MTEDEKRAFDAWESLRDHAWREFEEKSRFEWRLSFGIWTALLVSAGALIADGAIAVSFKQQVTLCVVALFVLIVVVVHAGFLYWIQTKLQETRGYLSKAQDEMRKMIGAPAESQAKRSIWRQYPMYVELAITILLVGVLILALKHSSGRTSDDQTFTLYRNSVTDLNVRIHVATFNADEKDPYNRQNCETAQQLFQSQSGVKTKFWCEKGYFRR